MRTCSNEVAPLRACLKIASDAAERDFGFGLGEFIPDLLAFESVLVDAKVIDRITDHKRGKMINYLRIAILRVGLILNVKHARLEWERIVV